MRISLLALVALVTPSLASAQNPKRLVFDIEDVSEIVGEVQKPEVAVFITRQNLTKAYELKLEESLLPKIYEALEQPPF